MVESARKPFHRVPRPQFTIVRRKNGAKITIWREVIPKRVLYIANTPNLHIICIFQTLKRI